MSNILANTVKNDVFIGFSKASFSFFLLLLFGGNAFADSPISALSLGPFIGENGLDIVKTGTISGTCGKAVVEVSGYTGTVTDFFTLDPVSGAVAIFLASAGGPPKSIRLDSEISDFNGMKCLSVNNIPTLLFWSNCSGSSCGDDFNFFVFNMDDLSMVEPKGSDQSCDAHCADEAIGSDLPDRINKANQGS